MLPEELEVEPEELQIALKHIQNFEPTGVGARNLGECLALQLAAMPESTPYRAEALDDRDATTSKCSPHAISRD